MRGISTVIATILLLVMIVVITAGVFYFFRGTLTTATATGQEAITGAISESEIQARVRIANYAVVDAGGWNVTKIIISNALDDNITISRIDIEGISLDQPLVDCTNYTIEVVNPEIAGNNIGDICVNTTETLSSTEDLEGRRVIIYITVRGRMYSLTEYLS